MDWCKNQGDSYNSTYYNTCRESPLLSVRLVARIDRRKKYVQGWVFSVFSSRTPSEADFSHYGLRILFYNSSKRNCPSYGACCGGRMLQVRNLSKLRVRSKISGKSERRGLREEAEKKRNPAEGIATLTSI